MGKSISQPILENSRDRLKLRMIRERLGREEGGIYNGYLPSREWSEKYLGESSDKVILASPGISKIDEDFTVLGGWCAVRTKCLRDISSGFLTNLLTGERIRIDSVETLAEWLLESISADQIIESIGVVKGTDYVAISEEQLWAQKIVNATEQFLKRNLTKDELSLVENAISINEKRKYEITKQYIEFIVGKPVKFLRVVDRNIYDDLIQVRDNLLLQFDTSINELIAPTMNRIIRQNKNKIKFIEKSSRSSMYDYIDKYSLVWIMYTGPYLELLKSKGYVHTEKAVIIEPWSHPSGSELEAKALFNEKIFGSELGINNYLYPGGINENLGMIGMDEISNYSFAKSKVTDSISDVPNIKNYKIFIEQLQSNESISNLDLVSNRAFFFGVNYNPYGKSRIALLKMIEIRNDYMDIRNIYKNKYLDIEDMQVEIVKLRSEKSSLIKEASDIVIQELYLLLSNMFLGS
jgi:hypothetical protein